MLRFASVPLCLAFVATGTAGCYGSSDLDCELSPLEPKIKGLQKRYAMGSRATIDVWGEWPLTLESSNPSVVRVDRIGRRTADLRFVGSGQATLRLENEVSATERTVEVVPHGEFFVVLSEIIPIPIGQLSGAVLLAGEQYVLVTYLDAEGRKLYGDGLAELNLSPGLRLCDARRGSLEFHCLYAEEPGLHELQVSVGDDHRVLPFRTVLESDVVGIELLQPDEEELRPRTWVQVDVVGVTEDGTHVAGLHPLFNVSEGEDWYVGYFAYQYDPDARPQILDVEALGRLKRTKFRGVASEKTAFGCAAAAVGNEGPIPAIISLFSVLLLIRLRARQTAPSRE